MRNNSYVDAWDELRRRTRWLVCVCVAWILSALSLAILLPQVQDGVHSAIPAISTEWFGLVFAGAGMVSFAGAALWLQWFPCPRCHDRFFATWFGYWPFARRCARCGLRKWQVDVESISDLRVPR